MMQFVPIITMIKWDGTNIDDIVSLFDPQFGWDGVVPHSASGDVTADSGLTISWPGTGAMTGPFTIPLNTWVSKNAAQQIPDSDLTAQFAQLDTVRNNA